MAEKDFKLETQFTDSRGAFPYIASAVAILAIIGIFLTMTTGVAARLLPMDESYLTVLIPAAPDGSEALSLQMLEHEIADDTLTIRGKVFNRTDSTISGLLAVIAVHDRFRLPLTEAAVPLDPPDIPSRAEADFTLTMPAGEQGVGGFKVRFRLPDEGPFIPHKDERPAPPPVAPLDPNAPIYLR